MEHFQVEVLLAHLRHVLRGAGEELELEQVGELLGVAGQRPLLVVVDPLPEALLLDERAALRPRPPITNRLRECECDWG